MIERVPIVVASGGTTSAAFAATGLSLVGLVVPAIDSSTIGFEWSPEEAGTFVTVKTNSGSPAAVTLGTADTGAKVVAVPEEVGRLAAAGWMRLVVASQGAQRTFTGMFQRR